MKNEIILYRPNELVEHVEVRVDEETVWLNRQQIANLFNRDVKTIGKHINKVFLEGELEEMSTVAKFATVQNEGGRMIERQVEYYNLDVIISVGYPKVLNQAVKRNIFRFPENFRFQLTIEEANELHKNSKVGDNLRSQIATSSSRSQFVTLNKTATKNRGQNIKYIPYAFTEQGVAMLSAVLRSDIAVKVSIQIINAFVEMRKLIANHQGILQRMEGIERKQLQTDQKFEQVFKALESKNVIPTQGVFFDGQVFDAYQLASQIIRSAKLSIVLIDNYIDESTLTHLVKKNSDVSVLLLTKNVSKQLTLDVQKANEQYDHFKLVSFAQSHDRFLIIDHSEVFHLGASLKDLGKKWFAFSRLEINSVEGIMNEIIKYNSH